MFTGLFSNYPKLISKEHKLQYKKYRMHRVIITISKQNLPTEKLKFIKLQIQNISWEHLY